MNKEIIGAVDITRRDAMKGGAGAASLAAMATGILPTLVTPAPSFAQDGREPLGGQPPRGPGVKLDTDGGKEAAARHAFLRANR